MPGFFVLLCGATCFGGQLDRRLIAQHAAAGEDANAVAGEHVEGAPGGVHGDAALRDRHAGQTGNLRNRESGANRHDRGLVGGNVDGRGLAVQLLVHLDRPAIELHVDDIRVAGPRIDVQLVEVHLGEAADGHGQVRGQRHNRGMRVVVAQRIAGADFGLAFGHVQGLVIRQLGSHSALDHRRDGFLRGAVERQLFQRAAPREKGDQCGRKHAAQRECVLGAPLPAGELGQRAHLGSWRHGDAALGEHAVDDALLQPLRYGKLGYAPQQFLEPFGFAELAGASKARPAVPVEEGLLRGRDLTVKGCEKKIERFGAFHGADPPFLTHPNSAAGPATLAVAAWRGTGSCGLPAR